MLLAEITTVSRLSDGSSYPTVLYGDFNSVPWSPLYNFVRESSLEYDSIPICKRVHCPRRRLQLLARLALVGQTDLEHNSSDHLLILARFRLCP
ncbi:protein angel homolog 2-like [Oncorhynchus tshawytscha]|uniref:protein angel homolog 2-like n=1 Tax=Oncorhynchus tshawytscha TaxID=74940 RepID=UPI001C3CE024|nr:protein angel homolog 2-like [Oncorhynchus tshawytscha]